MNDTKALEIVNKIFKSVFDNYYGVFYEYDGLLYGRLKEQGAIYQPQIE